MIEPNTCILFINTFSLHAPCMKAGLWYSVQISTDKIGSVSWKLDQSEVLLISQHKLKTGDLSPTGGFSVDLSYAQLVN